MGDEPDKGTIGHQKSSVKNRVSKLKARAAKKDRVVSRERYLKLPYCILNLRGIRLIDKVLLAHFHSFGEKGCWQSNATLGEMFMVSPYAVTRSIGNLKQQGLITIKSPKGCYRTIWAVDLGENAEPVRQNRQSEFGKNAFQVQRGRSATNNNTNRENYGSTTATPEHLPAGGQAPALLAERKAELAAKVAAFKEKFAKKPSQPLSQAEFAQRRAEQRARLECKE